MGMDESGFKGILDYLDKETGTLPDYPSLWYPTFVGGIDPPMDKPRLKHAAPIANPGSAVSFRFAGAASFSRRHEWSENSRIKA